MTKQYQNRGKTRRLFLGLFFILVSSFLLVSTTKNVIANAPQQVIAGYDEAEGEIYLDVYHSVANPSSHYIDTVKLWVNDILVTTETFTEQPTSNYFRVTDNSTTIEYGDVIKGQAICNLGGDGIDTYTYTNETETPTNSSNPTNNLSIPLVGIFLPLFAVGLIILRKKR